MSIRHIALAAAATAALAACTQTTRVGSADLTTLYTSTTMGYAARGGELATEVRGNPFGTAYDNERVVAALKSPGWHRSFRFTTRPNPETASSYRLILRFNPPPGGPVGDQLCRGQEWGNFAPGGGPIVAHGTLCADDRLASEVRAYGGPATSPEDPAFQTTMNAMLAELLPPVNRAIELNGDRCGDC
jgi:hypothetical protein